MGSRRLELHRQARLIEARGLASRSKGLGQPGTVNKSKGFRWARLAQGHRKSEGNLSIKVRGSGAGLAQDTSEGFGVMAPGPAGPPHEMLPNSFARHRIYTVQELSLIHI